MKSYMALVVGLLGLTSLVEAIPAERPINSKNGNDDFLLQFQSPSNKYRPKFRYWFPDASVPASTIREDIASVAEVGGGGVEFLPFYFYGLVAGGPTPTDWTKFGFGSLAYVNLLATALEQAKESNLVLDIAQGASEGQGVPSVPRTPGLSVQLLYGTADLAAGKAFNGLLPSPKEGAFIPGFMHTLEKFGEPTLKAILAGRIINKTTSSGGGTTTVLDEESVVDITNHFVNGSLQWQAPLGEDTWKIIAIFEDYTNQRSCSPGIGATDIIGNGSWIVDHFSADGAKRITSFWEESILNKQGIRDLIRTVGEYFWEDSMEMQAALFWTPTLANRFEARRGYSVIKYLPLLFTASNSWSSSIAPYTDTLIYGGANVTDQQLVLDDYRLTLTEGYQEYLQHFVEWARSLNVKYSAQTAYNLPLDLTAAVPIVDVPELESLAFPTIDLSRQFSGSAMFENRSIVSTEVGAILTASYSQTVPELLTLFKKSFASSVSTMVIHGFAYSGEYPHTTWPGVNSLGYQYSEMWNSQFPAWTQLKDAFDYTARNSLVLQSGQPQTDLAFYFYAAPWTGTNVNSTITGTLGFSYDYVGPDNLLSKAAIVEDKTLVPSGPSYKALVFTSQSALTDNLIDAIERFAAAGLPIVFIDPESYRCLGLKACSKGDPAPTIEGLISRYENVRVVSGLVQLQSALQFLGVKPRASLSKIKSSWYTIWRNRNNANESNVFIYNEGQSATQDVTFEMDNSMVPYSLNAWTGERSRVLQYRVSADGITIPVTLYANQTAIYSFSPLATPKGSLHVVKACSNVKGIYQTENGTLEARVGGGPARLELSNGLRISDHTLQKLNGTNLTSWDLDITSYAPSSPNSTVTAFTTSTFREQSLKPWTEIPGLQTTSGVGHYNTTFQFNHDPNAFGAILTLGVVRDTMRVWINDRKVPALDIAVPEIDITPFVKRGVNTLQIVVTSTLFNAVKARANSTMTLGISAASNPLYLSTPYAEFGLLGPVQVQLLKRLWLD